jgi:hypothetical protein
MVTVCHRWSPPNVRHLKSPLSATAVHWWIKAVFFSPLALPLLCCSPLLLAAALLFSPPHRREAVNAPPPRNRPPRRSCASFLLDRGCPQATAPSAAEEKVVIHSPVHIAPPCGLATLTVHRGRLHHHDLLPSSPPLQDLRAGALHHSSSLPPVVPSHLMCTTVEHPSPVRFSSLWPLNRIAHEPGVIRDRIPCLPAPLVHRISGGATTMRHDLSTSSILPWAGSQVYLGPARGGPLEQWPLGFFFGIV